MKWPREEEEREEESGEEAAAMAGFGLRSVVWVDKRAHRSKSGSVFLFVLFCLGFIFHLYFLFNFFSSAFGVDESC